MTTKITLTVVRHNKIAEADKEPVFKVTLKSDNEDLKVVMTLESANDLIFKEYPLKETVEITIVLPQTRLENHG